MKILIMGLPGAGKTTLANLLAVDLGAVWFDADWVRPNLWPELGYSREDRISNARRMGALCETVAIGGQTVIASFICPTPAAREAFGSAYTIWIDRIKEGRFADTNHMFTPPEDYNVRLSAGTPEQWLLTSLRALRVESEMV